MTEIPWWLLLLNALVCLVWSALALLVTWGLVRLGRAGWERARDHFGQGMGRWLALLCAAILFMGTVPRFLEVPLRVIYGAVVAIPLQGMAVSLPKAEAAAESTPVAPGQVLAATIQRLISGMVDELSRFQADLPYVQVVFFLIVWLALGQGIKLAISMTQRDAQEDGPRAISQALRAATATRGALVLLLSAGLALCIAAITAVSELRETEGPGDPSSSVDVLAKRLEASKDTFGTEYPFKIAPEVDPVVLLKQLINKAREPGGAEEVRADPQALATAEAQLAFVEAARAQTGNVWTDLVTVAQGRYARATQDAQTVYDVASTNRRGLREQHQHFLAIVQWHQDSRFKLRSAVDKCKSEIIEGEAKWCEWATDTRALLRGVAARGEGAPISIRKELQDILNTCHPVPLAPTPERPDFGASLGPLKPIAGWLLETESLQLALIVGMLGAGLLGSAMAALIDPAQKQDGRLASVVVRGVSAAIVTFLAAQGGLSTLTSNTSANQGPNPYVLLLACFVAAVYSEQVWKAVQVKLSKKLGEDKQPEVALPADLTAPAPVPVAAEVPRTPER